MTVTFLDDLRSALGPGALLTDPADCARYLTDWTGAYTGTALAVVRPASTEAVAETLRLCAAAGVAITPQGGNTGLAGGGVPLGDRPQILLSLDRMKRIRQIDPAARTATVEAGCVLQQLQEAVAAEGLVFPLMFGARGSCTIGGNLSTNAGGSNVLRYGNTRALCLGIEAVMADGSVVSDLSGLRKDNTGYDLRDLMIGAEGTLGIITAACLRLYPVPVVRTTAFLALRDVASALNVLNRLQDASGGLVEAFEYMPAPMMRLITGYHGKRAPMTQAPETGLLLELASTRADDAAPDADGTPKLQALVIEVLDGLMEDALVEDAVVATSEAQRDALWELREGAAEAVFALKEAYMFDISLPLAAVPGFVAETDAGSRALGFEVYTVAHLGDGNLHCTLATGEEQDWAKLPVETQVASILDRVAALGGSFSAEHGIGQSKLAYMHRYRAAPRLAAMRAIRQALDPAGLMNPGKTIPDL
ncbi:FAD-binding oxidoreductase [Variovorax sp. OV700]|uniref:FAD-binding oxidoreductase n=1 Tax=Variovorax sp. OV700 TaxID=1882826 RepID=UPI0008832CCC|nr:FAD-binding oxidoreductase [Variovorax sp. OV700]SDH84201.1 FAD/FMN-containing dehydrogenase [Variovorax sp. OV700]